MKTLKRKFNLFLARPVFISYDESMNKLSKENDIIDQLLSLSFEKDSLSMLGKSELKKCESLLKKDFNGERFPIEILTAANQKD